MLLNSYEDMMNLLDVVDVWVREDGMMLVCVVVGSLHECDM